MSLVDTAKQNVGIGEVLHESLFVIRSIKAFPADRVVREGLMAAVGKVLRPILEGLSPLLRGHGRLDGLHRHVLLQKTLDVLTHRESVFLRAVFNSASISGLSSISMLM